MEGETEDGATADADAGTMCCRSAGCDATHPLMTGRIKRNTRMNPRQDFFGIYFL
jgi:hypothetical protein